MYREKPPEETFKDIQEALKKINVLEIEKVNLDYVNIPVYYVKREVIFNGKKGIALNYGKGYRDIDAKVSASMEAIERASAVYDKRKIIKNPENPINIEDLILPPYSSKKVDEWVIGKELVENVHKEVPSEAVFYPVEGNLFRGHTNGLAAGNSLEEALVHGILEVVERDSWSIADFSPRITIKINPEDAKDERIHKIIEEFESKGVKITLKYIATLDIPVVVAISDDKNPLLMCMGVGCHLNPEIAILRALTELAQSRATQLHGFRRDTKIREIFIKNMTYERAKKIYKKWFEYDKEVKIEDLPNLSKSNIKKNLKFLIDYLPEKGFNEIIYADLTKYDIPAVRVIIPKMEIYSVDKDRISKNLYKRTKEFLKVSI